MLNIAHRGARSLAPENTLAAAEKGLEIGADLWETDVTVTADGKLILFHDLSLGRTTDVETLFPDRSPWIVSTFKLDEILQLNPGARFIETDPFEQIAEGVVSPGDLVDLICVRVPTLREALVFTQDTHWRVNLELKPIPPPMEAWLPKKTLYSMVTGSKGEPSKYRPPPCSSAMLFKTILFWRTPARSK